MPSYRSAMPSTVIAAWDEAQGDYVIVNPAIICTALWASEGIYHAAGSICGDQAVKKIGDVGLCQHHYNRAMEWHHAEVRREREANLDYGWDYESRRWDPDAAEVVYYIRRGADGLIKIGTTISAPRRLSQLRCEHGDIQVLFTHRGNRELEGSLHLRFAALRVHGEWFRPGESLWAWIIQGRAIQERATPSLLLPGTVPLEDLKKLARGRSRKARVAS
jgi:hypothetical protein